MSGINLYSQIEQKKEKTLLKVPKWWLGLFSVILIIIVGSVICFCLKLYINVQADDKLALLNKLYVEQTNDKNTTLQKTVEDYKSKKDAIDSISENKIDIYAITGEIDNLSASTILSYNLDRVNKKGSIKGSTDDISKIINISKNLKTSATFSNVTLTDINKIDKAYQYNITFTLNNKQ